MPFSSTDMTPKFEAEISEILYRVLNGDTIRSGCGPHCIERHGDGVKLSRITAQLIAKRLEEHHPTEADMRAFGASDAACYKWPGDTAQDRALRAAYIEGAADSSNRGQGNV